MAIIVSSDADFTPLVMHLREKGAAVYGFGERKTPEPFRSACTKFLFLDQLADPDEARLDEYVRDLASWLVDVLNVITGNLDRPGGAMFPKSASGPPNRSANAPFVIVMPVR